MCSIDGEILELVAASGSHEEADTRVWLHATITPAETVIIYSPDTDVFFIGLPMMPSLNKKIFVQFTDSPYEISFLCMNRLADLIENDICF